MEDLLKKFVAAHVEQFFKGYTLFKNEYQLKDDSRGGSIDLVLKHKTENRFIIIELKYEDTDESTITQINKYFMSFLKKHKIHPENVRRVIIDVNIPSHIQELCSISNIECKIISEVAFKKWKKEMKHLTRPIDDSIVDFVRKQTRPVSTREISVAIGVSWHPVHFHCFQLQTAGKIDGFKVGNMNLWEIKEGLKV
jgi:hypothetical protein